MSRWLFSTNHKDIGTLYFILKFFSGVIGTGLSTLIWLELSSSSNWLLLGNYTRYIVIVVLLILLMIHLRVLSWFIGEFVRWIMRLQINKKKKTFFRVSNIRFLAFIIALFFVSFLTILDINTLLSIQNIDILEVATEIKRLEDLRQEKIFFSLYDQGINLVFDLIKKCPACTPSQYNVILLQEKKVNLLTVAQKITFGKHLGLTDEILIQLDAQTPFKNRFVISIYDQIYNYIINHCKNNVHPTDSESLLQLVRFENMWYDSTICWKKQFLKNIGFTHDVISEIKKTVDGFNE